MIRCSTPKLLRRQTNQDPAIWNILEPLESLSVIYGLCSWQKLWCGNVAKSTPLSDKGT